MTGRALILGNGQIGRATAIALRAAGWQVDLLGRTSPIGGGAFDRRDSASLAAAIGPGADLLIDSIGFTAADAMLLGPLALDIGHLVVISSAGVYADARGASLETARTIGFPRFGGPVRETHPTVPPSTADGASYAAAKVAMEQQLLGHMACPVAVLRPCAVHGAGSRGPREWWFVKRLLDGRAAIRLAHAGKSQFHSTAAAAIAAFVVTLAARRVPGIFNIADPQALSVADIGAIIAAHMGSAVAFIAMPGAPVGHIGRTPWSVPHPFVLDCSRALAAGHVAPGDYASTVVPTIDWLVATAGDGDWQQRFPALAGYGYDQFDYAAEDAA
jgi:nucleoside-diphosphate-sugar epimerase